MELDSIATLASPSTKPEGADLHCPNGVRAGWRPTIYVALANAMGLLIVGTLRQPSRQCWLLPNSMQSSATN